MNAPSILPLGVRFSLRNHRASLGVALFSMLCSPPAFGKELGSGSVASPGVQPQDYLEKAPLILGAGEQRLLRIPGMKRFSLGSQVLRARALPTGVAPDGDALLLKALVPGSSDLWVWKEDGQAEHRHIRIEKSAPEELKPALEKSLGRLEEVDIVIAGGNVVLRGEISTVAEAARVRALSEAFPKEIQDETALRPELLEQASGRLQAWLVQSAYRTRVKIECRNGMLVAFGALETANDQASLKKKLRSIFPAIQLEIASLPDENPTVHFKVFLLELRKNRFRQLGLSWPGSSPGAFRVTTSGIEDLLGLDLTLEALEGDGSARVLSNPELVVRAPGEAELFSGGELPIQMRSNFYSNVSWKNFGLTLKLKITHVAGERIRLEVFTEVSHLDRSISEDKLPGLQANRMKTQVDARFGRPILLSGLLQQSFRQSAKGLPWLRQIPVLGSLFGSEDYLNEKSELVAILLPSAVPPEPPTGKFGRVFDWQPQPEPIAPEEGR